MAVQGFGQIAKLLAMLELRIFYPKMELCRQYSLVMQVVRRACSALGLAMAR